MDIALVTPAFPSSLWDFAHCRDLIGGRYTQYPLALPTLAGATPARHSVRLHDENVRPLPDRFTADLVGISAYAVQRDAALALAARLRAQGLRVVLGGPLVCEDNVAELAPHVDALFVGEAEATWPRFLADLERGAPQPVYRATDPTTDFATPRYDLLPVADYATATVETTRGCPYLCEFCEIPIKFGRRPRKKPVAQVLDEVRRLHGLGADSIFFIDDHFIGDRAHALRLLRELATFVAGTPRPPFFSCQISINYARDTELLRALAGANFRRVFIGLESPDPAVLARLHKHQNLETDLTAAVAMLQDHGLLVWGSVILGADGDDVPGWRRTFDFLQSAAVPVVMVGLLQALPGTPLHDRLQAAGRLLPLAPGGIRGEFAQALHTNVKPAPDAGWTLTELARALQGLVGTLYQPRHYASRLLRALRHAPARTRQDRAPLTTDERRMLLRMLRWYLLTLDFARSAMFLRVAWVTLLRHRDRLDEVVMHLIAYKHLSIYYGRVAAEPLPHFPHA